MQIEVLLDKNLICQSYFYSSPDKGEETLGPRTSDATGVERHQQEEPKRHRYCWRPSQPSVAHRSDVSL